MSFMSALVSQWGFHQTNGGRPDAAKVMVVVTDGESHDSDIKEKVIAECEKQGITRFGIAVSDDLRSLCHIYKAIVVAKEMKLFL